MTNPETLFLALRLLEKEPLTAQELWLKASGKGPERSMKTFRRALTDLENFRIPLIKEGTLYRLPEKNQFCQGFAGFLKYALETLAAWRTVCYGDVDRRAIAALLATKAQPVDFFWQLLDAAVCSRRIEFLYQPQHPGTRQSLVWVRKFFKIGTPENSLPINMIPHFLVFSGQHFLVLGENLIDGEPQQRQYEVAGIPNIAVRGAEQKRLRIDPNELYRHSVRVWVGGDIHEVIVEDTLTPETGKKIKVNGEDEILSHVMASVGRLRLVDPPAAIVARAESLGLPQELVFRFSAGRELGKREK